jgi:hypothetical protein
MSSAQLQYIAPDPMSSRRCTNCFARDKAFPWYARVAAWHVEKEHREEALLAPNIANEPPAAAFQTNGDFGAVPSADRDFSMVKGRIGSLTVRTKPSPAAGNAPANGQRFSSEFMSFS